DRAGELDDPRGERLAVADCRVIRGTGAADTAARHAAAVRDQAVPGRGARSRRRPVVARKGRDGAVPRRGNARRNAGDERGAEGVVAVAVAAADRLGVALPLRDVGAGKAVAGCAVAAVAVVEVADRILSARVGARALLRADAGEPVVYARE